MARSAPGEGQDALFSPTCPNGVPLSDAVSILIKELRRGNEMPALYWAFQIEDRYFKYLWRRLAIFCAEDVGLANPFLITQIRSLWESYMQIKEESSKKKPDENLVTMAVVLTCQSPKNREIDHKKNLHYHLTADKGWAPAIPEYAIDMHTAEGKRRLKTETDKAFNWMFVASYVENDTGLQDARLWHLRNMAAKGHMNKEAVEELAQNWFDEGRLRYGLAGNPEWPTIEYRADGTPIKDGQ
jgi:replication-associated recombination protein RarA